MKLSFKRIRHNDKDFADETDTSMSTVWAESTFGTTKGPDAFLLNLAPTASIGDEKTTKEFFQQKGFDVPTSEVTDL